MKDVGVVAVGPTCAKALMAYGVTPDVMPDPPKMGHMVDDLWPSIFQKSERRVRETLFCLNQDSHD